MKNILLIGAVLFIFAVSCYNPFFPEKKDTGKSSGATGATPITQVAITITRPVKGETPAALENIGGNGNFTITAVSWFPNDEFFLGGGEYTATVRLTANHNYSFSGIANATINENTAIISDNTGTTVKLSYTFPKTLEKDVTSILVKTQPTLTYIHGETLDLAGLAVTLIYSDSTTEDVAFADFDDYALSTYPVHGSALSRSDHDSEHVVITYGSLNENTNTLTVNRAAAPDNNSISLMFIAGSTQLTQNVDLDDLRSDKISDYGYMTYTATITDEDDILETPKIGTVTSPMAVTVKDTKADMQSAVITVTAISQNYYPFTITVNIGVTGKTLADITVTAPDTIIYGETLGDPKAETEAGIVGTFTFRYTGTLADGNYTQIDPSYNKPVLPGSYYVTAILTSDTHAGMRSVGFIIERKTLTWNDDGAVSDKIYDLRSVMPVINQPTLNGIINNDDVTVEEGRALALLPYAGTHIVTGDGYGIDGADAWKYYEPLEQPCFGEAVINKAPAPFFTFPTSATAITYGQTLADSMLNITYNYNGTFAWTTPAAVPIVAQSGSGFSVIFTPSAYTLANYEPITTLTTNVSVTVHRANPVVTWPSDLTATFGQLLGDVSPTGNGSGIPAGRFEWVTPENSVGDAGIRLQTLVYRPNDTANYNSLSHNVNLTVNRANPVVTLPTNLTATFGQRLYEISLPGNGSGVPAGIFAWDSPANLVGGVGRQTHPIIFTPNDTANYNTLTRGVDVTVHRANPVVTWPTNLTAIFWQSLSDVALPGNGTSNTPGTFVWINPNDSVGITGTRWHAVRFVPHDAQNYNVVTGNTTVTVTLGLIEMVYVEGGRFMYGRCARGNPTGGTLTDVGSFFIGKYQVTQDQWRDVMTDNSSGISVNPSNFSSNPAAGEIQGRRPVEQVSWYDVIVFCNRLSIWENLTPAYEMQTAANPNVWSTNPNLWGPVPTSINDRWDAVRIVAGSTGYRLPTEYQWEFAAKGGRLSAGYTGTASDTYFIYSGSNNADSVGWYDRNSGNITREVGRLAANELGLYDMSGNVWEWCWDLYSTTSDFRVLRGGCWYYNEPTLRSADQLAIWSNSRNNNIGFRLVRP